LATRTKLRSNKEEAEKQHPPVTFMPGPDRLLEKLRDNSDRTFPMTYGARIRVAIEIWNTFSSSDRAIATITYADKDVAVTNPV
jgi:hypothetical protein